MIEAKTLFFKEFIMELLERRTREMADADGQPTGDDNGTDALRADAERFLHAADNAVTHALSANSQAFVNQVRQSGGQ
jgi:hypothetical protein